VPEPDLLGNDRLRTPQRKHDPKAVHFHNSIERSCLVLLPWYIGSILLTMIEVERVQTGVRVEKRLLKVLKALAELKDLSLGDLLEGIVLHAFEGKAPFGKETLRQIGEFKKVYGMTLRAADSHKLREKGE